MEREEIFCFSPPRPTLPSARRQASLHHLSLQHPNAGHHDTMLRRMSKNSQHRRRKRSTTRRDLPGDPGTNSPTMVQISPCRAIKVVRKTACDTGESDLTGDLLHIPPSISAIFAELFSRLLLNNPRHIKMGDPHLFLATDAADHGWGGVLILDLSSHNL